MSTNPTTDDREVALSELQKTVSLVYSGRHGCACGCRGNYSDRPAHISRMVNKIRAAIADGAEGDVQIMTWPGMYVAVDTHTRSWTAYTDGRTN